MLMMCVGMSAWAETYTLDFEGTGTFPYNSDWTVECTELTSQNHTTAGSNCGSFNFTTAKYITYKNALTNVTSISFWTNRTTNNTTNPTFTLEGSTDNGASWTTLGSSVTPSIAKNTWGQSTISLSTPFTGKVRLKYSCTSTAVKLIDDIVITTTSSKTLLSIAVSGTPTKVTYKDGETFDPTGLVVTGTYSDNNTGDLTSQASFNCTPSTMALGTTTVSVIATVNEVSSEAYNVSVTVNPNVDYVTLPWEWTGGGKAGLTAIEGVTAIGLASDYANSNAPYLVKLDDTGDYIQVKTNEDIGKCTIKVKMIGGDKTSSISVRASKTGEDFKTIETLTISGSQNAELELSTSGDLGSDYRYVRFVFTKGANIGVGGISIDKADGTSIDVTNVESIEVTGTPEVFWKGDTFNSNGMSVTATYNNGETEVIDNAKCTFSGHKQNTPGLQTITVSYEGATDTYEIEVKTIANTQETAYTTAQAIALIDAGKDLSTEVYVTGVVSKVDKLGTSGGITFWISEDGTITDQFEMYYCMNLDGQNFEDVDDIETGATIVAYGKIMYFKNSNVYEMNAGKLVSYTAPVHETATITLNDACHDADGMVYATYSNASAWVVPSDLEVSVIAVVDGSLFVEAFNTGDVVPANTGVMVSAMEGGNYTITLNNKYGVDPLEGAYENALRPSGDGITAESMANADANCTYYRLTMHNGTQIGFAWGAAEGAAFNLAANKAYLAVPKSASVKSLVWFTGEEDAIKNVEEKTFDTVIYDMQGRKVSKAQKGLYIINGRKMVK